jgi:transposase InsO family protein
VRRHGGREASFRVHGCIVFHGACDTTITSRRHTATGRRTADKRQKTRHLAAAPIAGRTLTAWADARGVTLRFIRPGKPIENAYVEGFNGKCRDECLNEHWFVSLTDAQAIIEAWRLDYNTVRPHSSWTAPRRSSLPRSVRGLAG